MVILSHFDMHINATHRLKLGIDERREKEGVVILSHFDIMQLTCNGLEEKKEGVVILQ